jgi:hypothetical protein
MMHLIDIIYTFCQQCALNFIVSSLTLYELHYFLYNHTSPHDYMVNGKKRVKHSPN